VVLARPGVSSSPALALAGLGVGIEKATIDGDEPMRAEGLMQACKQALSDAGLTIADTDYRITDCNGEQFRFKEAALLLSRMLRVRKAFHDIWHPADCIGEVGAAAVPLCLGVALAAHRKGYAPESEIPGAVGATALCHFGNDDGRRGAVVVRPVGAGKSIAEGSKATQSKEAVSAGQKRM
jgi:3-oxoacyl-[acyl-carrier-protein] synthase I